MPGEFSVLFHAAFYDFRCLPPFFLDKGPDREVYYP